MGMGGLKVIYFFRSLFGNSRAISGGVGEADFKRQIFLKEFWSRNGSFENFGKEMLV